MCKYSDRFKKMVNKHNDRYHDFNDDAFDNDHLDDDMFDREITRIPQSTSNQRLGKNILEQAQVYWEDISETEHSQLLQSLKSLSAQEPYFDVLTDELDQPIEAKLANDALNLMHFWMLIQQNEAHPEQFNLLDLINTEYFQNELLNAFDALDIGDSKIQRRLIIEEAFKLYQFEYYAGCIPVIYAQLEGILTEVLITQGYLKQNQTKFIDVYKIVPGLKGNEIKSLWHKAKISTELNRYFAELAPYKMDSSSTVTMTRHNMLHGTDVVHFTQARSFILFIWLFSAISFMSTVKK